MGDSQADRIRALDGLRGWAALSVVGFHFGGELFGPMFPVFRNPYSGVLLSGELAVLLFFCISGFVLTYPSWRAGKLFTARQFLKRHSRLAIPVLAGTLIVVLLLQTGLTAHREAGAITRSWLTGMLRFEVADCNPLTYALWGVFVAPTECAYNPFLWTMAFELWCSFLVLLVSLVERPRWLPYAVLVVLSLAVLAIPHAAAIVAAFTVGALAALAYRDGLLPPVSGRFAWPAMAACAIAVAALPHFPHHYSAKVVLAAVILVLVVSSPGPAGFLGNRVSQFLGRISFPLYLMQFPVLVSVASYAVVTAHRADALNEWSALGIMLASVALSVFCAWLFLPVERLTAWIGRQLQRLLRAGPTALSAPRAVRWTIRSAPRDRG